MNAATSDPREAYRTMTGDQYDAYLDKLVGEAASSSLKVVSAHELVLGRPLTPEEQAADEATVARLAAQTAEPPPEVERVRYQPVSADELSRSTHSRSLIQHVLPQAEIAVINGPPGAGKTTLALAMGVALTNGTECFGKKTQLADVVYWLGEGRDAVNKCMKVYREHRGLNAAQLPRFVTDSFDARNTKQVAALALAIGTCDVLVLDTLSSALPAADQNSSADMGALVSACQFLHRKTGAVVLVLHHPTKSDEQNLRGSGVLLGAADTVIQVSKQGDYRSASVTKQKTGREGPWCNFKLAPYVIGRDEWGDPETAVIAEAVEAIDGIKPPKGATERALWDYAQSKGTERFSEESIVANVTDILRKTNPKVLPKNVRRALKVMVGEYFTQYGDDLSLRAGIVRDNAGWLDGE